MSKVGPFAIAVFISTSCLFADFSYEETSKVTGGMMAGMMKFAGAFSKKVREPIRSTVAVKGDRMVHLSADRAQIVDLGRETITDVQFDKKTYSVMTFADMTRLMSQAMKKMKSSKDADKVAMDFKISTKDTGQSRQIAGFNTHEVLMTMEMQGTDKQSGNKGGITMTADIWLAPKVPGYEEVKDFYRRMGEKLAWTPGGALNMLQGRPEFAKGLSKIYNEGAKMDGIPVYQIVKMNLEGMPQGSAPPPQAANARNTQPESSEQDSGLGREVGTAIGQEASSRRSGLGACRK